MISYILPYENTVGSSMCKALFAYFKREGFTPVWQEKNCLVACVTSWSVIQGTQIICEAFPLYVSTCVFSDNLLC